MSNIAEIRPVSFGSSEYRQALELRRAVFVQEQGVPEAIEVDEFEATSQHFLGTVEGVVAVTGRLRVKDGYIKFERIATHPKFRGDGHGVALMRVMTRFAQEHYPQLIPFMNAQQSAVGFYRKLGWQLVGEPFEEAGIPHQAMQLSKA